jgi:putative oxidoreductase
MVAIFAQIGLGQWFRVVTGLVELLGVVALLIPGFAVAGGLWLGVTMVCAIIAHVTVLHTSPVPPLVLLLLNLIVVWLRGYQLAALRTRVFG